MGPLAQLVAHLHDAQGVTGSSPVRPTRKAQVKGVSQCSDRPRIVQCDPSGNYVLIIDGEMGISSNDQRCEDRPGQILQLSHPAAITASANGRQLENG